MIKLFKQFKNPVLFSSFNKFDLKLLLGKTNSKRNEKILNLSCQKLTADIRTHALTLECLLGTKATARAMSQATPIDAYTGFIVRFR